MSEKRDTLRHFLATLAYRAQKALRDAPAGFSEFQAGAQVRTPHTLLCHMINVLGYARTYFIGGTFPSRDPTDFQTDIAALHAMLGDLSRHLQRDAPLEGTTEERLLQGPLSDAMTHVGQLAMLRRLAGSPVAPENFIKARIQADNVGPEQAEPASPDAVWRDRSLRQDEQEP